MDQLKITIRHGVLSDQYLVGLSAPLQEVFTIILSIDCDVSPVPTVSVAIFACQGVFSWVQTTVCVCGCVAHVRRFVRACIQSP